MEKVASEMKDIIGMFNDGYKLIDNEISKYINAVKALKTNEVPAKMMKGLGRVLEVTRIPIANPLIAYGAKGIGAVLDFGGDYLEKMEKTKKKAKKQDIIEGLESITNPYSDLEPLNFQIEAVNTLNSIYNKKVEVVVTKDSAFIKY